MAPRPAVSRDRRFFSFFFFFFLLFIDVFFAFHLVSRLRRIYDKRYRSRSRFTKGCINMSLRSTFRTFFRPPGHVLQIYRDVKKFSARVLTEREPRATANIHSRSVAPILSRSRISVLPRSANIFPRSAHAAERKRRRIRACSYEFI